MIDIKRATCLFASRLHSVHSSRQLNAISIKSLFKSKCWLLSFVKITMNDLIRESLKTISIVSKSLGSISSKFKFSFLLSFSCWSTSCILFSPDFKSWIVVLYEFFIWEFLNVEILFLKRVTFLEVFLANITALL